MNPPQRSWFGRTLSHTGIYGIAILIQNATSLVMLPIYTRFLSPADYGIIELLNMIIDVVGIVFGMRVDQGMFRYYHAYESTQDRHRVVSTVMIALLALNAIGAGFVIGVSHPLAATVLGDGSYWVYVALFAPLLMTTAVIGVPFNFVRLQGRPGLFLGISIAKLVVQVIANIIFIIMLDMKALGAIYAALASQALVGFVMSAFLFRAVGFGFDKTICRRLLSFSMPLIGASLLTFYMTFGDRYFLKRFTDLSQVGIYALGYRFGFAFGTLAYQPFKRVWDSQKYELQSAPDPQAAYRQVFSIVSKVLIVGFLFVSVFIDDFLHLIVGAQFWAAGALVPFIVAAFVARPLTDFCNFGLLLKERTRHIGVATLIAAVLMTGGYLLLIPMLGSMGAAITAFIGAAAELWWVNRMASKCYDMGLDWRSFFLTAGIAVGAVLIARLSMEGGLPFLLRLLVVIVALFAMYVSPAFSADERARMHAFVNGGWQSLRRSGRPGVG